MDRKYYDRFFGLYKHIHEVVFTIDAELTENNDNCTIELRNNIQQIFDETNEFQNIPFDLIMSELKEIFYSLTKENKESYIIDILQQWVEFAPFFDIKNEREIYWIEGRPVNTNTDFYKTAKDIIKKNEKILVFLKASNFEKYIFYCFRKKQQFFNLLGDFCYLLDIDFSLLQEKVAAPPQTTKTKDYSELFSELSNYISNINVSDFNNIINHHSLSPKSQKAVWIGKKVGACYFCDYLKMSYQEWNILFRFPDNIKLHPKYKDKLDKGSPIIEILKTHLSK